MFRLKKLFGIVIVLGIVFFVICDEKGIKIGFENNHIVFNQTEKKSDFLKIENVIENNNETKESVSYKNSNLIHLNYEFKSPRTLRKGDKVDTKYLTKFKQKHTKEELNNQENIFTGHFEVNEKNTISSVFQGIDTQGDIGVDGQQELSASLNDSMNTGVATTGYINQESVSIKTKESQQEKRSLNLKKGATTKHNFLVENEYMGIGMSDSMLQDLLENEEIDFNTLDSENDEFLQKVFEKTKDIEVMNLIVETYLNEYQFAKAKKFIDNLPEMYADELKPSLNLRVAFNSFPLGSATIYENLQSLIQYYVSKNEISNEDKNRYLGVLALISQKYSKFFEISKNFESEKNKTFALKIQGYKDQIAKQMGMPDYYFDTLVSLELFNQGLFQPAKVLALYSLQENSNYILPYQVLAYANFLTNSRDASVEYLKKLEDLDPNNAEKYRFLMGVAFYRNEKYEQSVVMLSMIKDESLRLDAQRYLINNYLKLDQKNKLIDSWNKLLGSDNLVASDFYTYFYESFFHPYSEGKEFQIYAYDIELANKMIRVCSMLLQNEEKVVCTYGTIGRNIALGEFDGMEQYLLNLAEEYPQGYLYQALGDYYIQHGDLDKAKLFLLKAVSLTQKTSQKSQIKKLLKDTM